MAKLNEQLKAEIVFNKTETISNQPQQNTAVIISAKYKDIYRQYSFVIGAHHMCNQVHIDMLVEEAKNILTHSIELALKAQNEAY